MIAAQPAHAEMSAQKVRRLRKSDRPADTHVRRESPEDPAGDSNNPLEKPVAGSRKPSTYVCPMHADFTARAPAVCGVCGMALQPVQENGIDTASGRTSSLILTRRQADLLNLRFAEIRPMRIERWLRSSGRRIADRVVAGQYAGSDKSRISAGLRVRAFPMESRNRIFSGMITKVWADGESVGFEAALDAEYDGAEVYALEVILVEGTHTAIPSDALLFTTTGLMAFRLDSEDSATLSLTPVPVRIGKRGEVYYEVLHGLREGDRVALVGLFYLDAAFKLGRASGPSPGGGGS